MPIIRGADAVTYEIHGVSFLAYANPATGSSQLSAWTTHIPAGTVGVPHTISHEEVFRLVTGRLRLTIDGEVADLEVGDVAVAPPGSTIGVDNIGDETASMWVTTSVGLRATMADGSELAPPWVGQVC
jgi:quercetin dioxygenase-like cupin family protein